MLHVLAYPQVAREALLVSGSGGLDKALELLLGESGLAGAAAAASAAAGNGTTAAATGMLPAQPAGQAEALLGGGGEDELTQEELIKMYGVDSAAARLLEAGEDRMWVAKQLLDKLLGNILANRKH